MNIDDTEAGRAKKTVHDRLMQFCSEHGSPNKAAGILKTEGLSFQWIKGFAGGQITNPTIETLQMLEQRLAQVESESKAA